MGWIGLISGVPLALHGVLALGDTSIVLGKVIIIEPDYFNEFRGFIVIVYVVLTAICELSA